MWRVEARGGWTAVLGLGLAPAPVIFLHGAGGGFFNASMSGGTVLSGFSLRALAPER